MESLVAVLLQEAVLQGPWDVAPGHGKVSLFFGLMCVPQVQEQVRYYELATDDFESRGSTTQTDAGLEACDLFPLSLALARVALLEAKAACG